LPHAGNPRDEEAKSPLTPLYQRGVNQGARELAEPKGACRRASRMVGAARGASACAARGRPYLFSPLTPPSLRQRRTSRKGRGEA